MTCCFGCYTLLTYISHYLLSCTERIQYKLNMLVHHCVHGFSLTYLQETQSSDWMSCYNCCISLLSGYAQTGYFSDALLYLRWLWYCCCWISGKEQPSCRRLLSWSLFFQNSCWRPIFSSCLLPRSTPHTQGCQVMELWYWNIVKWNTYTRVFAGFYRGVFFFIFFHCPGKIVFTINVTTTVYCCLSIYVLSVWCILVTEVIVRLCQVVLRFICVCVCIIRVIWLRCVLCVCRKCCLRK